MRTYRERGLTRGFRWPSGGEQLRNDRQELLRPDRLARNPQPIAGLDVAKPGGGIAAHEHRAQAFPRDGPRRRDHIDPGLISLQMVVRDDQVELRVLAEYLL